MRALTLSVNSITAHFVLQTGQVCSAELEALSETFIISIEVLNFIMYVMELIRVYTSTSFAVFT